MTQTTTKSQGLTGGTGDTSTGSSSDAARTRARLDDLLNYIQNGRIIEAMNEFYHADVRMQENGNAPTVGLPANIERERQFLAGVKEWKGFSVLAKAASDDVSFVENRIEFIATSGAPVSMQQVSVARWRDGKIVEERFYYDASAK